MTLRFHKKIYPKTAVEAAIEAFAEVGEFRVTVDGDYAVVEIRPQVAEDTAELAGEFRNFVLGTAIALRGER
ncbi:MAG TPA: HxsD-like protein [Myxococcota bacterium]|jgi:hypothetical protein|nr:HxsD-like protein [Myxococcota bacterium]